ncbi:MAG TPA: SGNH/GDSL hydrolase family protein [Chthoniobacteraceae bacterium]|nr:SGNH/GDSL hydrolase family protein [Chthoniobacteraceae bacterium]
MKPTTLLFQGDSITDAGRNRDRADANQITALGGGYAALAAAALLSQRPAGGLEVFNRGISGNRVTDLLARWRPDTIHLRPDTLSILIGVNDCWHQQKSDLGTPQDLFAQVYRLLLEYTRRELPEVRLVLCEPFALPCGGFQAEWMDDIKARAATTRQLAEEFGAAFVPFQGLFDALAVEAPAEYWLYDGVHPTPGGHQRMAELWLKAACF